MSRFAIVLCVLVVVGQTIYSFTGCSKPIPSVSSTYQIDANHEPFLFKHEHDRKTTSFRVDWPPKDPADSRQLRSPPLLSGELVVSTGLQADKPRLNVRIELVRADTESDRLRWNRNLKFPEYDWMSRVRTWDREQKWLWPNLPFLLRAHGIERQQRYGGVDPGKGIDNDFAAIVIRSLDSGQNDVALITAEWHPPQGDFVDRRSVVHRALSDDLQWQIPDSKLSGELGVWLIYADFLEFSPPDSWPSEPEFDGGILSYFSIRWQKNDLGIVEIVDSENVIPPNATGVNWKEWLSSKVAKRE